MIFFLGAEQSVQLLAAAGKQAAVAAAAVTALTSCSHPWHRVNNMD